MQAIVDYLITTTGKLNTAMQINICIMYRNRFGVDELIDYVGNEFAGVLGVDQQATFVQSIVNLDSAIVSVNL